MFSKFLKSECCMNVLSWVLEHPEGYYQAPIVHIECGSPSMGDFMAALTVLQGVDIIKIDDSSEDLNISFNPDSSISQLLTHFKDEFNDLAFTSMNVSPALSYFYSDSLKTEIDNEVMGTVDVNTEAMLEACKNYKDMEIKDQLDQDIYDLCVEMEENGIYEDFIKFIEEKIIDEK